MIDLLTCEVIRDEIAPSFASFYIGLPHDNEEIQFPAILMDLRGDSVVGSPLQRGTLTAAVMHQADDSTVEEHIEAVRAVRDALANVTGSGSSVQIFGSVPTSSETENTERIWSTNLAFTMGYAPQL
jgi:hypothetical protein